MNDPAWNEAIAIGAANPFKPVKPSQPSQTQSTQSNPFKPVKPVKPSQTSQTQSNQSNPVKPVKPSQTSQTQSNQSNPLNPVNPSQPQSNRIWWPGAVQITDSQALVPPEYSTVKPGQTQSNQGVLEIMIKKEGRERRKTARSNRVPVKSVKPVRRASYHK
jgi:hypothetical protein